MKAQSARRPGEAFKRHAAQAFLLQQREVNPQQFFLGGLADLSGLRVHTIDPKVPLPGTSPAEMLIGLGQGLCGSLVFK